MYKAKWKQSDCGVALKLQLVAWFLVCWFGVTSADAAEVTTFSESGEGSAPWRTLLLEGDIEAGDADKVRLAISDGASDGPVLSVEIASRGGNMIEGLMISALLNSALIEVIPAEIADSGYCQAIAVQEIENCHCYSICALIWMAAVRRSWSDKLGVHRPYVTKQMLSKLTLDQAESDYTDMLIWLRDYLTSQHVPDRTIDLALQYGSNEIRLLSRGEVAEFSLTQATLYEYLDARCLNKSGREVRLSFDREFRKAYAESDAAALLLLGYGKAGSDALESAYSRCLSSERYRLAQERQSNIFVLIEGECKILPMSAHWVRERCAPATRQ